jgi:hypothetical protein
MRRVGQTRLHDYPRPAIAVSSSPRVAAKVDGCGPIVGERERELNDRCVAVAAGAHGATSPGTWARTAGAGERRFGFPSPEFSQSRPIPHWKIIGINFLFLFRNELFQGVTPTPRPHFFFPWPRRRIKIIMAMYNLRQATRQRSPPSLLADPSVGVVMANHHSESSDFPEAIVLKKPDSQSLWTQSSSLVFAGVARPSRPNLPIPTRIPHSPPGLREIGAWRRPTPIFQRRLERMSVLGALAFCPSPAHRAPRHSLSNNGFHGL